MKKLITFGLLPASADRGLLVLRVVAGLSLFLKHGTEKLLGFAQMSAHFPNLLHLGIFGLVFATLSDGICSLLIVVGLATRWASLVCFINIFAAWALVHHFLFFGRGSDHGELVVLYLAAFLTIFIAGPGRLSLDAVFFGARKLDRGLL